MKRILFGIALIMCSITALSQATTSKYKIAGREISTRLFQQNLNNNVARWVDSQGWNRQERALFAEMYHEYVDNLATGRFSTDAFYTITDHQGKLNEDIIWYYDGHGNLSREKPDKPWYMSQSSYERKLRTFNPSRKVATYAKIVGQALLEKLDEKEISH